MGNRVLRYAADRKFKFDNIFMVAAVSFEFQIEVSFLSQLCYTHFHYLKIFIGSALRCLP